MSENNSYYYCHVEGKTDTGCVRPANEDWLDTFECSNGLVAVVCDGMGGHVGGQIASHLAVETIREFLSTHHFGDAFKAIIEACNAANAAILQRTAVQPELTGMGATCVMLIVRDGKVYIGSVGDSRIYLVRSRIIRQLTKDQSYVQTLVDAGQITPEEAEHHPRKNEITNALGLPGMEPAMVLPEALQPEAGDSFVLCSDGLSGMVPDDYIARIASNHTDYSQAERVAKLVERARQNGGLDNITCQIVEFLSTPPFSNQAENKTDVSSTSKPTKPSKLRAPLLGFAAAAVLCLGGYWAWSHFHEPSTEDSEFIASKHNDAAYVSPKPEGVIICDNTLDEAVIIEEVEATKSLVFYIKKQDNKADTIVVEPSKQLRVNSMTIFPEDGVNLRKGGNSASLTFSETEFTANEISFIFKDEEDKEYIYVFTVEKPAPKFSPNPDGSAEDPGLGNEKPKNVVSETDPRNQTSTKENKAVTKKPTQTKPAKKADPPKADQSATSTTKNNEGIPKDSPAPAPKPGKGGDTPAEPNTVIDPAAQ